MNILNNKNKRTSIFSYFIKCCKDFVSVFNIIIID